MRSTLPLLLIIGLIQCQDLMSLDDLTNVLNYQTQVLNASMNNIAEILRAKLTSYVEDNQRMPEIVESLQNVGAIKQSLDTFKRSMQELRVKVIHTAAGAEFS